MNKYTPKSTQILSSFFNSPFASFCPDLDALIDLAMALDDTRNNTEVSTNSKVFIKESGKDPIYIVNGEHRPVSEAYDFIGGTCCCGKCKSKLGLEDNSEEDLDYEEDKYLLQDLEDAYSVETDQSLQEDMNYVEEKYAEPEEDPVSDNKSQDDEVLEGITDLFADIEKIDLDKCVLVRPWSRDRLMTFLKNNTDVKTKVGFFTTKDEDGKEKVVTLATVIKE